MSIAQFFRKAFGFETAKSGGEKEESRTLHQWRISAETAMPVAQLVLAIRSKLPNVAVEQYEGLSKGQKALWEASIYLEYHRLASAAKICEDAYGDANTPGDEWVALLIDAIKCADKFPGTDAKSHKEAVDQRLSA